MTARAFLVDPSLLAAADAGDTLVVAGPEGRHAASVVRLAAGDRVLIGDGAGRQAHAEVLAQDRHSVTARVLGVCVEPPPPLRLVLVQALAKAGRDEQAVEAATELGVDRVVPWQAARSVVQWRGERAAKGRARWEALVAAATKQSRRFYLPEVSPLAGRSEVVALLAGADLALVLDPDGSLPIGSVQPPTQGSVVLVVGPEGGLDEAERAALVAAGGVLTRLGPQVLRCSSAGPAALAVLNARARWN